MSYDDPLRSRTRQEWKAQLQPWLIDNADAIDVIVSTGYIKMLSGNAAKQEREMAAAWAPVAAVGVPIVGMSDNPWHATSPSTCLAGLLPDLESDSCSIDRKTADKHHDTFEAVTTKGAERGLDGSVRLLLRPDHLPLDHRWGQRVSRQQPSHDHLHQDVGAVGAARAARYRRSPAEMGPRQGGDLTRRCAGWASHQPADH